MHSVVRNHGLAAVLSFFFAWLRQTTYNGQIGKGVIFVIIQILNIVLMFVLIGFLAYFIVSGFVE